MLNKMNWFFARPAVATCRAAVCFAYLFRAHDAANNICIISYMRTKFCVVIVRKTYSEFRRVQLIDAVDASANSGCYFMMRIPKHM